VRVVVVVVVIRLLFGCYSVVVVVDTAAVSFHYQRVYLLLRRVYFTPNLVRTPNP
jgi:hypothetical protein